MEPGAVGGDLLMRPGSVWAQHIVRGVQDRLQLPLRSQRPEVPGGSAPPPANACLVASSSAMAALGPFTLCIFL